MKILFDNHLLRRPARLTAAVGVFCLGLVAACQHADAQTTVTADFNTTRSYASGTGGDPFFDGMLFNGGLQAGTATLQTANANATNPGLLTVSSTNGNWQANGDNGFFLYRKVTGDFTATVSLNAPYVAYNTAGIMARNPSLANGENWVGSQLIGAFGGGPSLRSTVNSAGDPPADIHASNPTNYTSGFLELTRVGNVFTTLYSTNGSTYGTVGSVTRNDLPATLQVGLYQANFTNNQATATFDNFTITAAPEPSTWALAALGSVGLFAVQCWRRGLQARS